MTARTFTLPKRIGTRVAAGAILSMAGAFGFASLMPSAHADTNPAKPAQVAAAKAGANTGTDAKGAAKNAGQAVKAGASAQDVINLARTQVGTHEDASGNSKFNNWYIDSALGQQNAHRIGAKSASVYKGQSWCDMFVSWLGQHTGTKGMGADAYTVSHAQWFKKTGHFGQTPKPGAVVFFAWNGGGIKGIDHVGIVVKDNHNGTINTIEGNTGNAVKTKVRDTSTVAGYGYPEYR
ncbi:CHAP domain-containing protein [Actinomadura verrucosospora]|uniref:CHAP domain-containing protein n=1 Tax=Actinomadura verrucosospora TaxID=46165 RepID=A0A7D3ZLX8_ACTVE|nr:CHAP domain-containing protein [Actinomadura verrucosospora]QKG21702.1 CHAP domain-containing protein [Actinomadura verrucosospora]